MEGAGEEIDKKIAVLSAAQKAVLEKKKGDDGTLEALAVKRNKYSRDLAAEALANDHDRSEWFRFTFEIVVIVLIVAVALGFIVLAGTWCLNIILGPKMWLTESQMRDLQGILTGALIIGLVSDHIKRRMN